MSRNNHQKKLSRRINNLSFRSPATSSLFSNTGLHLSTDSSSHKSQRDLMIDLIKNSKATCVICYGHIKNVQQVWNCRKCYQIIHLKCVMKWYKNCVISNWPSTAWRCPLCQNESMEVPSYNCFCGNKLNPISINVDIPHSCGQICRRIKSNNNAEFNNCYHTCTLLCHPGPCPQCVKRVFKKCCCGRTRVRAQCGVPVFCQNICLKELSCKYHFCEKLCHAGPCTPCEKHKLSEDENEQPSNSPRHHIQNNLFENYFSRLYNFFFSV